MTDSVSKTLDELFPDRPKHLPHDVITMTCTTPKSEPGQFESLFRCIGKFKPRRFPVRIRMGKWRWDWLHLQFPPMKGVEAKGHADLTSLIIQFDETLPPGKAVTDYNDGATEEMGTEITQEMLDAESKRLTDDFVAKELDRLREQDRRKYGW